MTGSPSSEATGHVVVVRTSRRLPGLLTAAGWAAVGSGPVYGPAAADPGAPTDPGPSAAVGPTTSTGPPAAVGPTLGPGGPEVSPLPGPVTAVADALVAAAGTAGTVVWLAGQDGDPELVAALGDRVSVERVTGAADPPGAGLLDVVAVMDRLRSPGGCPWDAEQTHDSLRRYLLEETYEAYDALVDGDLDALREELGDVLLQVVFHARLAEEADPPWSIDAVAAGLVAKLVRRHPHVFAGRAVAGAEQVATNWEQIKRAEKGRTSVTDGLARSQPALALAQALVRRATTAGLPPPPPVAGTGSDPGVGEQLLALVVHAHAVGLDAEAELRAAADAYARTLRSAETAQT